jgi:alpha/beta superfamily hydrolase
MQTPTRDRSVQTLVLFGQYVAARCTRNQHADLAAAAKAATNTLRKAGRALEDLEEVVQYANAERDAVSDDMSETAREANNTLASRSLDARRRGPHPLVFGDSIRYFTQARQGEQRLRGEQLIERVVAFLPADDTVRVKVVEEMGAHLEAWDAAVGEVEDAKNAYDIARIKREEAYLAWSTTMQNIYATLLMRVGKRKAEQHFPRRQKRKDPDGTATTA